MTILFDFKKIAKYFPFQILMFGALLFSYGRELIDNQKYFQITSSLLIFSSFFYFLFNDFRLSFKGGREFYILICVGLISFFESNNPMFSSLNNITFIAAACILSKIDKKIFKSCLIGCGIIFFISLMWFSWFNFVAMVTNGENRFASTFNLQISSMRLIFSGVGEAGIILSIWFFGCYFFIKKNKLKYFLMFTLLALILSTGSRSAVLGLLIGCLLIFINKPRKIYLIFILFLTTVLVGSFVNGSGMLSVNHRIEILREYNQNSTVTQKSDVKESNNIQQNVNSKNYPIYHNWILDFFISSPVAATIYIFLIIRFIYLSILLRKFRNEYFNFVATVTILVASLFDSTLVPNKPSYINLILVAIIFQTFNKYRKVLSWKKFQ